MNGRYYGGGIMAAPEQSRTSEEKTLSLTILKTKSKISALFYFPTLYKGKHTKLKKVSTILTGKDITVEFDVPSPLQIDGDVFSGVTEYTVTAYGAENTELKEKTEETV
jgi:diacylglycerol kinase family enzyme